MTLQRGWRDACWATRSWRWWGTASPRRGMEVRTCSETFGTKVSEAKVEGKEERRGGKKSIAYDRKEISTRVFRRIRSLENTSYERVSRGSRDTFLRERGNISSVKKKKKKGKENFRIYYFPEQQRNNRRSIRIRIIIIIILVPISLSSTMG